MFDSNIPPGYWSCGGEGELPVSSTSLQRLQSQLSFYLQVYVFNPKLGITFSETSNQTELEQEKQSNQKYTGAGYIPDHDGYIS